ncbi:hypothetical protein Q7P35_008960 [Cladosporium inversicolor]
MQRADGIAVRFRLYGYKATRKSFSRNASRVVTSEVDKELSHPFPNRSAHVDAKDEQYTLLVDNNANVNADNERHNSALHAASSGAHRGVVQLLLDNSADTNAEHEQYSGTTLQAAYPQLIY